MKAVILVGGEGTRLRPLTYDVPKQMLPIVGRPLLERVLEHLGHHGVDEAVLSLGYLPDAFMAAYPEGVAAGVRLIYAVEPEPYDTAGAVRYAADVGKVDDTFVVLNGDVLTDVDVSALVDFHRARRAEGTISLHPVDDPSRFGVVVTGADGQVSSFVEKPPADQAPTNLINAGIYVLEAAALDRIPLGRRVSIERQTFPAMVGDGRLFALADDAYWLDAGTPAAYLEAHRDLLSGRRGPEALVGLEALGGGVLAGGAVEQSGTVRGPAFLGAGSKIAPGALVERSTLGEGCVVEAEAVVRDSVLLGGCRVRPGAHVEESIVGHGATVGERCRLRSLSVIGRSVDLAPETLADGARIPE